MYQVLQHCFCFLADGDDNDDAKRDDDDNSDDNDDDDSNNDNGDDDAGDDNNDGDSNNDNSNNNDDGDSNNDNGDDDAGDQRKGLDHLAPELHDQRIYFNFLHQGSIVICILIIQKIFFDCNVLVTDRICPLVILYPI